MGRYGLQMQRQERVTAILQLLYTEATALEWLFLREKATLRDTGKGT
jgi:hypothetical protein